MSKQKITVGSMRDKGTYKHLAFSTKIKKLVLDDGTIIELDKFGPAYLNDAVENAQFLLEKGYIEQDEFDKRLSYIEDKGIKYNVVISSNDVSE